MKPSKKDLLRRAAIARKLKRLVRRPGFAQQDSRDAIQSKLVQGLLGEEMSGRRTGDTDRFRRGQNMFVATLAIC